MKLFNLCQSCASIAVRRMRIATPLIAPLSFCCLVLGACGEDAPPPVTLAGIVVSFDGDPDSSEPIAAVQVCEIATRNCITTNDDGEWELELPGQSEVALTLVKEGFVRTLVSDVSDAEINVVPTINMPTDGYMEEFAAALNTDFPLRTGLSFIRADTGDGGRLAGVTMTLSGGTGEPYYLDDDRVPDAELTETQVPGVGGFFEMPDTGETVTVEFGGTGTDCVPAAGWPSGENQVRFPILDTFVTQVVARCE